MFVFAIIGIVVTVLFAIGIFNNIQRVPKNSNGRSKSEIKSKEELADLVIQSITLMRIAINNQHYQEALQHAFNAVSIIQMTDKKAGEKLIEHLTQVSELLMEASRLEASLRIKYTDDKEETLDNVHSELLILTGAISQ